MNNLEVTHVKAFTKNPAEGNPAGVILDAHELVPETMISIAAQLGYSESAFVSASKRADFSIRYFTPTQEVDLCAHATIAAIHTLRELNRIEIAGIIKQETKAGILEVECQQDGRIVMTQKEPEFSDYAADPKRVAQLLGLQESDLAEWPIKIVSTGTPKLIIPVTSLKNMLAIKPDLEGIKEFCRESGAKGLYPFTTETQSKDAHFHARQFNPLAGIDEDPITGIAAGALAAYIRHFNLLPQRKFIVEQGYSMKKPGRIFVDATGAIKVGGYAVTFGRAGKNILDFSEFASYHINEKAFGRGL